MDNISAKDFARFQVNRKVTNLYKQFLIILEDIRDEKYDISEDKYHRLRKRVLDFGNDAIREIDESLDKLDISLKK